MVGLDRQPDLSWLVGLWTTSTAGQRATIAEAKQQSILKVNHKGALARSGAGATIHLESLVVGNELIINRPFLFWIARDGYPLPLFAAVIDYADWKNPGKLE